MTATALIQIATVFVPVEDQDEAIAFYRDVLGFEQRVDFTYGTRRWVEVAPVGSVFVLALVPPSEGRVTDRTATRCAIVSTDVDADHQRMIDAGVDVDPEVGRAGTSRPGLVSTDVIVPDPSPAQFCFRDRDGNRFLVVQAG